MSIIATMFVKLFFPNAVTACVKTFLLLLQHFYLNERQKKLLVAYTVRNSTLQPQIVAILLVNARKLLKFHCFKSLQNFVSVLI